jgi:hypothetical protein
MRLVAGLVDLLFPASDPISDPSGIDVSVTLGGTATGSFLTTLLVGAIMVALAPAYTEQMVGVVRDDIVGSFAYGIAALLVISLVAILLAGTVLGLLFVVPLLVLAYVVWAVGARVVRAVRQFTQAASLSFRRLQAGRR